MDIPDRYGQQDVYLTSVVGEGMLASKLGNSHIYVIEKARPPLDFEENYHRLPPTVDFERIVSNVKNSLSKLQNKLGNNRSEDNENINEKFKRYLLKEENKAIVSDSFWYAICVVFKPDEYPTSELELKKRIAKNYISFMLEINPELDSFRSKENNEFFKHYFDMLAQSVFYSFFYAFPKSRSQFNDDLKRQLLSIFSRLFTGIEISKTKLKWNIDLGTGNILKTQREETAGEGLPRLSRLPVKHRLRLKKKDIRYSPIMEEYLTAFKYRTRNYVKQYKMKLTQPDPDAELVERLFRGYQEERKQIMQWVGEEVHISDKRKEDLENYIKQLKKETINHHRRLEKRKAEELERGAHEYANYLVSMMNAGVTMTNLGAVQQT